MSPFPNITSSPLIFLLTGVPGLEAAHAWFPIPFCCLCITALSGNGGTLFVIIPESTSHRPGIVYFNTSHHAGHILSGRKTDQFRCLCCLDILLSTFYCHGASVLLAVAFDCFIATCNPLRCATILIDSRIIKVWLPS